ncbi:MAG: peptidylprolyl isomerase [Bryobacteraceae bacterium]
MPLSINGELVDDLLLREEAAAMRPRYEEEMQHMDPVAREIQLRDWAKENVIERVLLRQAAWGDPEPVPAEQIEKALAAFKAETEGKPGCATLPPEEDLRREIETRIRLDRLIQRITGKVAHPKNKDVSEFFKKNKERFVTPELVRAAHIVKNVTAPEQEAEAQEVLRKAEEELRNGADFAELADRYSDCPGRGGDLGYFPRGEMVQEFEDVVFALEIGKVSGIFRSVFGFHIAKLLDRKPAGYRALDEVREEIESALLREKQERALENFVDGLRATADVRRVSKAAS